MTRSKHIAVIHSLVLCLALLVIDPAASAAGKKDKGDNNPKADSHEKKGEPQPGDMSYTPPRSTNMPMLLIPVIIDGRRSHYLFVTYRLVMHNELQVDVVNQNIAWLHDAFMRDVFKTSPYDPKNPNRPDRARIEKRFREIANEVLHDDVVESVYFTSTVSQNDDFGEDYKGPVPLQKLRARMLKADNKEH